MSNPEANLPGKRLAGVFKAMMLLCVLVWAWGFVLLKVWPWNEGGEWLADFPIVVQNTDGSVGAIPFGQLGEAWQAGRIKSLTPEAEAGETSYEMISLQWKRLKGGMEAKASAWNFQTTVRYRIENETPILVSYQEISGKIFLIAIAGAIVTLLGIYLRKLRRK